MKIINSDIFNIKIPQPEPRSGDLLLAVPFMDDGCFSHAVVCLIEHSLESGTMGLVTNRLSGYTLNTLDRVFRFGRYTCFHRRTCT